MYTVELEPKHVDPLLNLFVDHLDIAILLDRSLFTHPGNLCDNTDNKISKYLKLRPYKNQSESVKREVCCDFYKNLLCGLDTFQGIFMILQFKMI